MQPPVLQLRKDKELVPSSVRHDVAQEFLTCLRPDTEAGYARELQDMRDFCRMLECAAWTLALRFGYQVTVATVLQQDTLWRSLRCVPARKLRDMDVDACTSLLQDTMAWHESVSGNSGGDDGGGGEAEQQQPQQPQLPKLPTQRRLRVCINKHCRNPDLTSYHIQKRAADEAMACFYHCSKCNTAFYE